MRTRYARTPGVARASLAEDASGGGVDSIAAGAAADLTWVSDDLRTHATWIAGRQVYGHPLAS